MSSIAMVRGRALPIRGDDIDTDRIIPARYLKSITFEGLEEHLFADDRAAARSRGSSALAHTSAGGSDLQLHPVDDPRYAGATIMIVNRNFGCGSSREHAPQAIYRRGIRAIVGESFSEIFFGNAVALGLACVKVSRDEAIALSETVAGDPTLEVAVDIAAGQVRAGDLQLAATLPPSIRDAFLSGGWDATGLLIAEPEAIDAVAARLPYLHWQ